MPRVETLTDIPDNDVIRVVNEFKLAGATTVRMTRQADGKWKVEATFPD